MPILNHMSSHIAQLGVTVGENHNSSCSSSGSSSHINTNNNNSNNNSSNNNSSSGYSKNNSCSISNSSSSSNNSNNSNNSSMASPLVVAVVGDRWSGKSALYVTHATKTFPEHHVTAAEVEDCGPVFMTVGADSSRRVNLDLFEVSGDMYDFNEIRHFNYRRSHIVLLCFSVVRPDSLENILKRWAPEVRQYCRKRTPVLLVGTQTDKRGNQQVCEMMADRDETPVSCEQGRQAARKLKAAKYIECSAKTKTGLDDVFNEIEKLAQMLDKRAQGELCVIS